MRDLQSGTINYQEAHQYHEWEESVEAMWSQLHSALPQSPGFALQRPIGQELTYWSETRPQAPNSNSLCSFADLEAHPAHRPWLDTWCLLIQPSFNNQYLLGVTLSTHGALITFFSYLQLYFKIGSSTLVKLSRSQEAVFWNYILKLY